MKWRRWKKKNLNFKATAQHAVIQKFEFYLNIDSF